VGGGVEQGPRGGRCDRQGGDQAREVLPSIVHPVGSTATDLTTALRHEPSGADASSPEWVVRQVGRHEWAARRDPVLARLGLTPDQVQSASRTSGRFASLPAQRASMTAS
jgi:hypothetical protein